MKTLEQITRKHAVHAVVLQKPSPAETLFYASMFIVMGAVAVGVVTLVLMVITFTVVWMWYSFPHWAGGTLLAVFSGAIAAEIYCVLYDVEKQTRTLCRRCREKVLPVMADSIAKGKLTVDEFGQAHPKADVM